MPFDPVDIIFAALGMSDEHSNADFDQMLMSIFSARALAAQRADEDASLVNDEENHGYLRRYIDGYEIYVPFNLASVFPGREKLSSILRAANGIKLSENNPICISGSTTFLGKNVPISDLDFCEYFMTDESEFSSCIYRKRSSVEDIIAVLLKIDSLSYIFRDNDLNIPAIDDDTLKSKWIKLDCWFTDQALGSLAATSVIIPTDRRYGGDAAKNTFVHQEAMISNTGIPRPLFKRSEIGLYLLFLYKESAKYYHKASIDMNLRYAIKSLKRSISFLLLVGAEEESEFANALEETFNFLLNPSVVCAVLRQRLDDLDALCEALPMDRQNSARLEIDQVKSQLQYTTKAYEDEPLLNRAIGEAETLMKAIKGLFDSAGIDNIDE
ncbi:hypothetical protein [Rhodoblastus sp.]|uniref:hypothetical protein n=1 Tax=Rhodoblastus sp. TaxID=1962975 RepID=UPI0026006F09|nr:hypothetical protein [Rhodoblastus sp.]